MATDGNTPPSSTILWRGLCRRGHETARLSEIRNRPQIDGVAVFAHQQHPCRLDYQIDCDRAWHTRYVSVRGWVADQDIAIDIVVDSRQRWWCNDKEITVVQDCIDLDLSFSPVTNLLPIRRCNLAVGEEIAVTAAWLRFPDFTLEPLDQVYRKTADLSYSYESAGGSFVTILTVNRHGFVTSYPDFWQAEEESTQ